MTSFYSPEELKTLGFKTIGDNVLIRGRQAFMEYQESL
jgi:hypothetical protein